MRQLVARTLLAVGRLFYRLAKQLFPEGEHIPLPTAEGAAYEPRVFEARIPVDPRTGGPATPFGRPPPPWEQRVRTSAPDLLTPLPGRQRAPGLEQREPNPTDDSASTPAVPARTVDPEHASEVPDASKLREVRRPRTPAKLREREGPTPSGHSGSWQPLDTAESSEVTPGSGPHGLDRHETRVRAGQEREASHGSSTSARTPPAPSSKTSETEASEVSDRSAVRTSVWEAAPSTDRTFGPRPTGAREVRDRGPIHERGRGPRRRPPGPATSAQSDPPSADPGRRDQLEGTPVDVTATDGDLGPGFDTRLTGSPAVEAMGWQEPAGNGFDKTGDQPWPSLPEDFVGGIEGGGDAADDRERQQRLQREHEGTPWNA